MKGRIATGIDIGTNQTKVVVVEEVKGPNGPLLRIIGTGLSESKGMRNGYVVDVNEVADSVRAAKEQAEATTHMPIRSGFVSIGGISLDEVRATGETVISRADQEITDLDMEKVRESARQSIQAHFLNRRILHEIPLEYRVDGVKALGRPDVLKGTRLEADFLFVSCLENHADMLTKAIEDADIEVVDCMASPLAGSYVTLSKDQKMKGCILINVGADTVSTVVYDEGVPQSVKVFGGGSTNITNDLALQFKVSLEDAEKLKLGRLSGAMYSRKKIDDVARGRIRTMFDAIDKHLRSIGKRGALPAGVILAGGGSSQVAISDMAKNVLALPVKIADLQVLGESKVRDSVWSNAYGLALWGLTGETEAPNNSIKHLGRSFIRFFKQFLP